MTMNKESWYRAFAADSNGDCAMKMTVGAGAGLAKINTDLDTALENVVDPATNTFRVVVN